ncbi:hypothetical protein MP228_001138 [Amoeboaphelidium protococcarum]|nr:hypothetical protein MP228_001138 [Amoeboaphelidium protococcarum]
MTLINTLTKLKAKSKLSQRDKSDLDDKLNAFLSDYKPDQCSDICSCLQSCYNNIKSEVSQLLSSEIASGSARMSCYHFATAVIDADCLDKTQFGKLCLRTLMKEFSLNSRDVYDYRVMARLVISLMSKCPENKLLVRDDVAVVSSGLSLAQDWELQSSLLEVLFRACPKSDSSKQSFITTLLQGCGLAPSEFKFNALLNAFAKLNSDRFHLEYKQVLLLLNESDESQESQRYPLALSGYAWSYGSGRGDFTEETCSSMYFIFNRDCMSLIIEKDADERVLEIPYQTVLGWEVIVDTADSCTLQLRLAESVISLDGNQTNLPQVISVKLVQNQSRPPKKLIHHVLTSKNILRQRVSVALGHINAGGDAQVKSHKTSVVSQSIYLPPLNVAKSVATSFVANSVDSIPQPPIQPSKEEHYSDEFTSYPAQAQQETKQAAQSKDQDPIPKTPFNHKAYNQDVHTGKNDKSEVQQKQQRDVRDEFMLPETKENILVSRASTGKQRKTYRKSLSEKKAKKQCQDMQAAKVNQAVDRTTTELSDDEDDIKHASLASSYLSRNSKGKQSSHKSSLRSAEVKPAPIENQFNGLSNGPEKQKSLTSLSSLSSSEPDSEVENEGNPMSPDGVASISSVSSVKPHKSTNSYVADVTNKERKRARADVESSSYVGDLATAKNQKKTANKPATPNYQHSKRGGFDANIGRDNNGLHMLQDINFDFIPKVSEMQFLPQSTPLLDDVGKKPRLSGQLQTAAPNESYELQQVHHKSHRHSMVPSLSMDDPGLSVVSDAVWHKDSHKNKNSIGVSSSISLQHAENQIVKAFKDLSNNALKQMKAECTQYQDIIVKFRANQALIYKKKVDSVAAQSNASIEQVKVKHLKQLNDPYSQLVRDIKRMHAKAEKNQICN